MFGALKRGFRSMASLYTCKECCWRTSTEKNTCSIARFPCGSTAFLYSYSSARSRKLCILVSGQSSVCLLVDVCVLLMDIDVLCVAVYDSGTLFDVSILDITDDDIRSRFLQVTQGSLWYIMSHRQRAVDSTRLWLRLAGCRKPRLGSLLRYRYIGRPIPEIASFEISKMAATYTPHRTLC